MPHAHNVGLRAATVICSLFLLIAGGCGGDGGGGGPMTLQNLYCFGSSSSDALGPNGGLLQGSDGNFYGTSFGGGIGGGPKNDANGLYAGSGTVFKITPTGGESVFHLFGATPSDAINPNTLILGSDGNFYGTAGGQIFKLTPAGVETVVVTSDASPDITGLIQGSDGNFYGTTYDGSGSRVFRLTPSGVFTTLHTFSPGDNPGILVLGSDGNLYGTTTSNSGTTFGTVFKITPDGTETVLHAFAGPSADGWNPSALIQGSDGNLYGTTASGGAVGEGGYGTAFKLTPEGVETILYSFTAGADGASPSAGFLQGKDGNFYGTTAGGTLTHAQGTLFKMTPAGVVTGLYSFPGYPGANVPESQLVQGSDGNLYGTTYEGGGGVDQGGCFYRYVLN
jgi:uncharacterized repeat protein (TIGR03803 family)